jgi:hypothetical protein
VKPARLSCAWRLDNMPDVLKAVFLAGGGPPTAMDVTVDVYSALDTISATVQHVAAAERTKAVQ